MFFGDVNLHCKWEHLDIYRPYDLLDIINGTFQHLREK